MQNNKYTIGMVGLGVMGRNLALNFADHGFSVAGYDKNRDMVSRLNEEAENRQVKGIQNLEEFVAALETPRSVMIMVPAGDPVDAVIADLLPNLNERDLIIDGGNSHFSDTDLRAKSLADKGFLYLGIGISGGESGARNGPSMMPGGSEEAYQRVQAIFEATAAKVDGESCVVYLGPGSAGHYVKMVHNGIEYAIMQLIAESYDLMKRGLNLGDNELHQVYKEWNQAELNSYLLEITAAIFNELDPQTGKRLIDVILDEAQQKGTGMWTSQDAMNLQIPVPTIDIAVAMRNLSALIPDRHRVSHLMDGGISKYLGNRHEFLEQLRKSLYAGMIISYAQGFHQLYRASQHYQYHLDLQEIARIWRGGCIIRSALLEQIRSAYQKNPGLTNLLADTKLGSTVMVSRGALMEIVQIAAELGIPTPGLMVSLSYLDGFRSDWLPANLIQAQRDFFGAHTYERIDSRGYYHTQWERS